MIEQFGLWTYNDGWQVLLLVCVMLVAAGILMGILWNTKGLSDELSGRKRQKELEYLRHRFAEMNVRSLDEVNVADPLSHVGESAPMPLTPAGDAFTPRKVQQPLGAGEVLNVGGVEVSQQQVAAIKSELLGDDDEPVTGFFPDEEKSEDAKGEETKGTEGAETKETKAQPAKAEGAEVKETKAQPVKTEGEKVKAKVEEVKAQPAKKDSVESSDKPASAKDAKPAAQQGTKTATPKASAKDVKSASQQGVKSAEDTEKIAPIKPAMLLVQANAERVGKIYDVASEKAKVEQPAAKVEKVEEVKKPSTVEKVEKPITSKKVEEVKKPSTADNLPASEQSTGLLAPVEDDESDSTPTGIFTPVNEDKKSETKDEKTTKKPVKVESASVKSVEPAADDAFEGITAHLSPEPADDDEGVTTTFAPVGSRSAYHMKGAKFMGELISTGSYDPKTDTTKLEDPSGDDKATTGFLND